VSASTMLPPPDATAPGAPPDPREPVIRLLRDLGSRPAGLSEREAGRRLERYGPNSLVARTTRTWPRALARQFTQPLAVLLMLAAVLSVVAGTPQLAWAIMAAVLLNALFAFIQERQAGRAVEALGRYLPPLAQVRRDGEIRSVAATEVVPGDVSCWPRATASPPTPACCPGRWRSMPRP
jgi:magnesium-transporting ATPase (P-type)